MTGGARLPRRRLFGYGIGAVGTGIFGVAPGLLLLYYLTDVLGVPAAFAGVLLVLPKVWDTLISPAVGAASDREAVRTARRTRLLLVGAVSQPVLFAALFLAPSPGVAAVWTGVVFLLAATANTCYLVPHMALPVEVSDRPDQRRRAMAWRAVFSTVGILVAGGLAPLLVETAGGGRGGYALMGAVLGAVLAAVLLAGVAGTRWIPSRPGPRPLGLVAALRTARGNRPFFVLTAANILQVLAAAVMLAGVPYAAAYRLGDYGLTSVMFMAMVVPSVVAVPVWQALTRRYGAVRCYLAAVVGFGALAAALYPAITSVAGVLALTAGIGVCYAALQLLPPSLVLETTHADRKRTGHTQSGAFTGIAAAADTGSLALGPGVYALVLAVSGFRSSDFEHPVAQSGTAMTGLLAGCTLLPALLMLASVPLVLAFRRVSPGAAPVTPDAVAAG
ncbi:MFS transporter [Actinomadura kijaniata]|uniref:MFS transporter n=1 Tax=Actinomadura kijaniata TaxID=46161 RepID=UPI0008376222|nr:MFS transporter [Actinomadura kijaniata]